MKIYIVEDEKFLREYMQKFLFLKGYEVDVFTNAEEFLKNAIPHKNDCLIVDVKLPRKSGFHLVESINKSFSGLKIIFISAFKDIENISRGFQLGASDYMKKPFELEELYIRIQHLYKDHSNENELTSLCGDFIFNKNKKLLLNKENIVLLSPIQLRLLKLLLINKNKPISFEYIMEILWWNNPVSNATLSAHINQIKKKIPCISIDNIRGIGYILIIKN